MRTTPLGTRVRERAACGSLTATAVRSAPPCCACRLWAALLACLNHVDAGAGPSLDASQLWCLVQLHLACLSDDERKAHAQNVGDGVHLALAGLVQLQPRSG